MEKVQESLDAVKSRQQDKEAKLALREKQITESEAKWQSEIERVAGMTGEEAKNLLIDKSYLALYALNGTTPSTASAGSMMASSLSVSTSS